MAKKSTKPSTSKMLEQLQRSLDSFRHDLVEFGRRAVAVQERQERWRRDHPRVDILRDISRR
jgi:hypothetical protein